jgi:hypothetical protein
MVKHRKTDPEEGPLLHSAFLKLEEAEHDSARARRCCSSWTTMVVMCAVVAVVCAIDRSAMSVAVLPMASVALASRRAARVSAGKRRFGARQLSLAGPWRGTDMYAPAAGPRRATNITRATL